MEKRYFMSELSRLRIDELVADSKEKQELIQMEIAELKSKYAMKLVQEKMEGRRK